MKLQYLLVKSRMRKLLIMNVVWVTVFPLKPTARWFLRKDPVPTPGRGAGF